MINKRLIQHLAAVIAVAFLLLMSGCTSIKDAPNLLEKEYTYRVYIPVVSVPGTNVGVDTEATWNTTKQWYNYNTNLKISCSWAIVEAQRGVFDWSSCDNKLGDKKPVWIVWKNSPEWSRNSGDPECKLPMYTNWDYAVKALNLVIQKYHPEYIEIWNEPDAKWEDMNPANAKYYGCIGDGTLYATYYNYLKRNAYTDGTLLVAGAVMSPLNAFFDVMMRDLTPDVDAVSFHCYPWYLNGVFKEGCIPGWEKATHMTDKPVHISEGGVMFKSGSMEGYEAAQIEHYNWLKGLPTKWFWYTVTYNGWPICTPVPCNTDLVTIDPVTRQVYPRPVWYLYNAER